MFKMIKFDRNILWAKKGSEIAVINGYLINN